MNEAFKALAMYALTGAISWVAGRYHMTPDQSAALMADAIAVATGAMGVVMHYVAYKTEPPKELGK